MKTISKPQKDNKWVAPTSSRCGLTKPTPKTRSLSQPANSAAYNKQIPRPHSGGDEKTLPKQKTPLGKPLSEDQPEEEEKFESATLLKIGSTEHLTTSHEPKDEPAIANVTTSIEIEQKAPIVPVNKPSCSGIPLRVRQTPPISKTAPCSKKASPRSTKPTTIPTLNKTESPKSSAYAVSPRRILETQFQIKKRRVDQLKKEIFEKQKPLLETYHALLEIKKKLEESGKTVTLDELKVLEYKDPSKRQFLSKSDANIMGSGECIKQPQIKIEPEMVKSMNQSIKEIPKSLLQICKNLVTKRLVLVELLEKTLVDPLDPEDLQKNIDEFKLETASLEKLMEDTFAEQEKLTAELVDKWQTLLKSTGDYSSFTQQIDQLQDVLKIKEQCLSDATVELEESRKKRSENAIMSEHMINELKDKIKAMEGELRSEKMTIQDHKDKNNLYDQRMKLLKTRMKELEQKQKETETKFADLQKIHRHAQDQLKVNEHRWAKEKEEILTKHKHDRQMLDKLTKDRSYFETRMKTLEELIEEKEAKFKALEERRRKEVDDANALVIEERMKKDTMQQMYDDIKDQLVQMEVRNKQAIDLVHTKNTFEPSETEGITTEREAELYTELLATRVALKAAEDQIQNYNREKLRFIDSIQSLQGDPEKDNEYIAKTLIKNAEKITELESKLTISEDTICAQKIEISNLRVDIDNVRQRGNISAVSLADGPTKDGDLKLMLHEGKIKLEQSLKKSLEYEHKIIRYEHDVNQQSKQICEMENLLKVRDGLISMMKAKKDELQMENDSLNKYANEIRDLLIQTKEEVRTRMDMVEELSANLSMKNQTCQHLEKRVMDLESSLSATNEKRFKLQDMIGSMEKELQSTKAQLTPSAVHSRYDATSLTKHESYTPPKHTTPDYLKLQSNFGTAVKSGADTAAVCVSEPALMEAADKRSIGARAAKRPHSAFWSRQKDDGGNMMVRLNAGDERATKMNRKEVEAWMGYYHSKLKYLKHTFRAVSNTMFERDLHLVSSRQGHTDSAMDKISLAVEVSKSFAGYYNKSKTDQDGHDKPSTNNNNKLHPTPTTVDVLRPTSTADTDNKRSNVSKLLQMQNKLNQMGSLFSNISDSNLAQPRDQHLTLKKYIELSKIKNRRQLSDDPFSDETHHANIKNFGEPPSEQLLLSTRQMSKETKHVDTLQDSPRPVSTTSPNANQPKPSIHILHASKPKPKITPKQTITSWKRARTTYPNSRSLSNAKNPLKSESESSLTIKQGKLINTLNSNNSLSAGSNPPIVKERKQFINHANNISYHLNRQDHREFPKKAKQHVPKLLEGVGRYKIPKSSGSLVWCKPTTDMDVNSVLISRDLMAHSLSKINANINSSLKLLTQTFPKINSELQRNLKSRIEIQKSNL